MRTVQTQTHLFRHRAGRRRGHGRRRHPRDREHQHSGQSTAAPARLSGLKARAAEDVNDRVNALNAAIDRANAAKGLGSGQGTLVAYLGSDNTPLQQLNENI